jgi:hypothetical protein
MSVFSWHKRKNTLSDIYPISVSEQKTRSASPFLSATPNFPFSSHEILCNSRHCSSVFLRQKTFAKLKEHARRNPRDKRDIILSDSEDNNVLTPSRLIGLLEAHTHKKTCDNPKQVRRLHRFLLFVLHLYDCYRAHGSFYVFVLFSAHEHKLHCHPQKMYL